MADQPHTPTLDRVNVPADMNRCAQGQDYLGREPSIVSAQNTDRRGFTKRSESEYDCFGAAHSSTSISAALGFAVARDLGGQGGDAIAVIGDGSMSAGMAYEADRDPE